MDAVFWCVIWLSTGGGVGQVGCCWFCWLLVLSCGLVFLRVVVLGCVMFSGGMSSSWRSV